MAKKYRQSIVIAGLAVVVIVVGFIIANSIKTGREEAMLQEVIRVRERENIAQAVESLSVRAQYQPYCATSVQRIDVAGEFIKVVKESDDGSADFFKGEEKIICPSTDTIESCRTIETLNFSTVYVCSPEPITSITDGVSGLQIRSQNIGNAVIIDRVILDSPGFAVVFLDEDESELTEPLAHSLLLRKGISDIVSIAVPIILELNNGYAATLYIDNGDGVFDKEDDVAITSEEGTNLRARFTATRSADT